MSSDEIVRLCNHELSSHAHDLRDLGDTDLPHSEEFPPQGGSLSSVTSVLSADTHRQAPHTPLSSRSVAVNLVSQIMITASAELCELGLGRRSRSRLPRRHHSRLHRHHCRSQSRSHRDRRRSHSWF